MPEETPNGLKVEKKDGRTEAFERRKVAEGIANAGASTEEAESIATQVESWAHQAAKDGVIKTLAIREKVLELLRPVNAEAAHAFEVYKKPR